MWGQVDWFKHNSFKGFSTLEGVINVMKKAGIPTEEIGVVEEEGEVFLRKPLSVVMMQQVKNGVKHTLHQKGDAVCDARDTVLNDAEFGIYTDLYAMEDTLKKKYTESRIVTPLS